jgi:hyperosmotically inducible protein
MKWQHTPWMAVAVGVLSAGLTQAAPQQAKPQAEQAAPQEKQAKPPAETPLARQVRHELSALPYYGVFDLLTFQVADDGTVTLGGDVVWGSLKDDAEDVVKEIAGVKQVVNKIEILPASRSDERLRWRLYRAIYFDPALDRYGTALSQSAALRARYYGWGWQYRSWGIFGLRRWVGAPFFGMEPVGEYAIHIVVKNGRVTLVGVVNSEADRDLAGMKARGVYGSFEVTNDLQVEKSESSPE